MGFTKQVYGYLCHLFFWLVNTEKLKMFGAVNKNVLCYIKETHVSKNYEIFCQEPMFPEVIKLFTNLSFGCH